MANIRHFDSKTLNFIRQQLNIPPTSLPKLVQIPKFKYKVPEDQITEAAVLIPLCQVDNKPSILFEERSQKLNSHCGEVW